MTQEEKNTLTQAAAILEPLIGSGQALALGIKKLIKAVEKTGKPSTFVVETGNNPLAHLVKEEQKTHGKRVTLKDTMDKNVLATSETKTNNRKK